MQVKGIRSHLGEPSKLKILSLFKGLWDSLRGKVEDNPPASSEETNEENQHPEPSAETPKPKDSSGLRLNLSGETLKDAKTSDNRKRLINLAKQWGASLTRSDDHHDVNNVIGPRILACQKSDSSSNMLGAFCKRLSWCDLIKEDEYKEVVQQWKGLEKIKKEFDSVSIFVVDDYLEHGWREFVCKLLGEYSDDDAQSVDGSKFTPLNGTKKGKKVNIYGCTGPEPLIQFLTEDAKFECRDFTQQISCGENGDKIPPDVILLDLRLPYLDERVKELSNLLQSQLQKTKKLAWPVIEENESGNDDQDADKALLLLPRLLAMALPLTPIILFSSTGQARIKETLKPYQNIITGFEKPRVLSDPESVKDSITALHEALGKAVKMMRLRLQLAHAQKAVENAAKERCQRTLESDHHHIEIYADETGKIKEGIASGVAFCVFSSEGKADCLQTKLEKYNNEPQKDDKGIGINCSKQDFKLRKAEKIDKQCIQTLDDLLRSACTKNRQSWSVVWTKMPEREIKSGHLSLDKFIDSPLDSALRFNLEFSLFVLIPYFFKSDFAGTVSIYLPTRDVDIEDDTLAEKYEEAFDLKIPRGTMIRTWHFGSGFPIVRGWLHEWVDGSSPVYDKIKKIKMTTLGKNEKGYANIRHRDKDGKNYTNSDYDPQTGKYPRLFHGIADWICSANQQQKELLQQKDLFPSSNWFVSEDKKTTEGGRKLMQALKASVLRSGNGSKDRDSDALRLLLQNSYIAERTPALLTDESCSQQRLILWALRNKLNRAKGSSLHLLCV